MKHPTPHLQHLTFKANPHLSVGRSALSVQRSLLFSFSISILPLLAADLPWRTYAFYQPRIERAAVIDAADQPLRYNHDSSVAWFRDRWFCLWNANTIPEEGAPGQLNYAATSPDGLTWSAPHAAFADPARAANPVPCPGGTQWQPNLLVVADRLWCLWSQNSKDAHNGCYLSVLDAPDGLWTNRLLTWQGRPDPVIDGKPFRIFPTQNPIRLSTGRILAPVTLIGPVSASAPPGKSGWYWQEKRNSVLYTDDLGATWHVSPGTILPGLDWRQWEPTLLERPDGSVLMLARNNLIPSFEGAAAKPEESLTSSVSRDGGATWTPHAFVPLHTVVSRMHLLPLPGAGRALLLHNDGPSGRWGADRRNLALFLGPAAGPGFTPGPGFTADEPEVAYPQGDIRADTLLVAYSQGPCAQRSIRVARISPLPDPARLHILPRSNRPAPPRRELADGALHLLGASPLPCPATPAVHPARATLEAHVNLHEDGVLFDNRTPSGGFVWAVSGTPFVHLGDPARNLRSTLPVPRGRWTRLAVQIDYPKGELLFRVGDATERVTFTPGRRTLTGTSATLFGPNPANSALTPFQGAIRSLTLDATNRLFDAAAPDALAPYGGTSESHAPETCALADGDTLRLTGTASAGVELDPHALADGDTLEFAFDFRLEHGDTLTLCTFGDALAPARVTLRSGTLHLETPSASLPCGPATPGAWQRLTLASSRGRTRAALDARPAAELPHAPQLTPLFLGEGYPTPAPTAPSALLVSLPSVRSRVTRPPAAASAPAAPRPKIIRLAYNYGPSELLHQAAERFARQLREDSGGALLVRLYPSGQLGNERELVEGLCLRSVDITLTGLAIIGWYAPEYGMFEAPFLWRDHTHVEHVWDGPVGEALRRTMRERTGAELMRPWFRGPRYLTTTSRKVLTPDDLKGLKIRVPELEVYIKAWQLFGANVTPIPFTDLFMALKLGVVEGQENPLATIYASHLHEVQKYVMETRHLTSFYLPALGPSLDRRLTPGERALLIRALDDATRWHNAEVARAEDTCRQRLQDAGVTFIPLDTEPFRLLAREHLPPRFARVWQPGLYSQISQTP